jgi:hypothetical protein
LGRGWGRLRFTGFLFYFLNRLLGFGVELVGWFDRGFAA